METIQNSQVHKYYFDHPEIWNQLRQNSFHKECVFLDTIFKKYGTVKSVLDIGCGTGAHAGLLVEMGYQTLGIDLNSNMIEFAKTHHSQVHFEIQGMSDFQFAQQFDALICLCTTFAYNLTNEEVMTSLKNFNQHLKKEGLLVIETFNPIAFLAKIKFDGSFFLEKEKTFSGVGLKSEVSHEVDERNQTMTETKIFFNLKSGQKIKTDVSKYRLFFPQEMILFLQNAGFRPLEIFGKYDQQYHDLDKTRMILISKKK